MPVASEITAVVGPNAAGKTALLHALSKLFGVSRAQRTVQRSDFHVGADDDIDDREPKDLFIDVLIGLPELADGTATPETIAPSFRHMQLEREDKAPVCRGCLVRTHEFEDPDGTAPVSRANQAAARERMSRSTQRDRQSLRARGFDTNIDIDAATMKPLSFLGSSLDDVRAFPETARCEAGHQLDQVQRGLDPEDWKPMQSIGSLVRAIRNATREAPFG